MTVLLRQRGDLKLMRVFDKLLKTGQRFFHDGTQLPVIDEDTQLFPGIPAKMQVKIPHYREAVCIRRTETDTAVHLFTAPEIPV